tara:strand:+ start:678 stop:962 length:285 start_codon:yes stop_codon:yes gene_type:complete
MTHKYGRWQKQYVSDFPDKKVYPLDCVPTTRPKSRWTNGVKAYERNKGSGVEACVGWFHPPRQRNKGWLRWSPKKRKFVPRPIRVAPNIEAEEE